MGINDDYGCFVDDENGSECVMDRGQVDDITWTYDDCFIAKGLHSEGKTKEHCKYWRSKTGDPWNDGLEFAINKAEDLRDHLVSIGKIHQANAIGNVIDELEVYVD